MALTKDKISALEISEELKKDILALFGDIEGKQEEVENLRKKVPTDSQKVVESVDYEKFLVATTELDQMKKDLQKKLETETGSESEAALAAFPQFFE